MHFLLYAEFSPSALFVQSPNNMYVTFLALATMCKAIVLNDIYFALQIFDCRSVPESPLYENLISNFPLDHLGQGSFLKRRNVLKERNIISNISESYI